MGGKAEECAHYLSSMDGESGHISKQNYSNKDIDIS